VISYDSQSKSKSKLCYDRRSVGQSVLVPCPIWRSRPGFYYCQAVSRLLMWGALSNERTGLSFTIAAGPRRLSHSRVRVPRDSWQYYGLRFETPPTWRARSPYIYPPRTEWPSYTPRHWVSFSSPPTTPRATVEVIDPASTWAMILWIYDWSVSLMKTQCLLCGRKCLECYVDMSTHGQKSVCIRKDLQPAISTQSFLVFLCLQAHAEKVPKFRVATACFSCSPPDLDQSKLSPSAVKPQNYIIHH
jgi:hypothetical protein